MAPEQQPTLFLWAQCPWASKAVHYLALRGISYAQCIQPITMPRPDLAALGVQHRRVPVLAVGRDIYCDSLLMIQQLEKLYPASSEHWDLSAPDPTGRALEKLLEKWTDVVVSGAAAAAIPSDVELLKDPKFQKDREELWGRSWTAEEQDRRKPAALASLRGNFDFLEDLLSDGRQWVLEGGKEPGLADLHAAWIFSWLLGLPNALPRAFFSAEQYPKTRAWLKRYDEAIAKAKKSAPEPQQLEGSSAISDIFNADFADSSTHVEDDPLGLASGDEVSMWPIDTGYDRRDAGKLVKLTRDEVAVSRTENSGSKEVRIHYPRWDFEIARAKLANGAR